MCVLAQKKNKVLPRMYMRKCVGVVVYVDMNGIILKCILKK